MSERFPEFSNDEELIEWFEQADLSAYHLDEALDVIVSSRIGLSLQEPWSLTTNGSTATRPSGQIEYRSAASRS